MNQDERLDELTGMVTDTLEQSGNSAQIAFALLQQAFDLDGGEILKALTPFPGIAHRGRPAVHFRGA
jgi:UDP-N-acetylmuramoylalanine-D-glutamate ligase